VERAKAAAAELAKRMNAGENDSDYYLDLMDQNGRKVQIPHKDRIALVTGMALHEKGKKCVLRGEVDEALEYFLSADKSFRGADSKFLDIIDVCSHSSPAGSALASRSPIHPDLRFRCVLFCVGR
jgi:hypothetical protein